jgi:hypothetical protein
MNIRFSRLLFAAAATLAVASPLAVRAYTMPAPVSVASCSIAPQVPQSYFDDAAIPGAGMLNISFTNKSPKAILKVEFAVSDGTGTAPIVDAGVFSTGIAIDHEFTNPGLSGNVRCVVRSVAFQDGSTWEPQ